MNCSIKLLKFVSGKVLIHHRTTVIDGRNRAKKRPDKPGVLVSIVKSTAFYI
ncbi:MAG: hypothetical protein WC685_05585 [Methylobacter sp.]